MRKVCAICLCLFIFATPAHAFLSWPKRISLSYGEHPKNNLQGGRIAVQWPWGRVWFKDWWTNLTGYWDLSTAYWHTNGNAAGINKSVYTFAFAPIFRVIMNRNALHHLFYWVTPYLEGSVGLSLITQRFLATQALGSYYHFQDLLGGGLSFGPRGQIEVSYHWLHYSNAGLVPPNNGITIRHLLSIGYRFA